MQDRINDNKNLLSAVRTVGIVKPNFNPQTKGFDQASLRVYGTGFWFVLIVEANNEQDTAILQQEINEGLDIYDNTLKVGDPIAYAGFPLGGQLLNEKHSPSYAEGVIGSEVLDINSRPKIIQISGPIIGGCSGSPIVLKNDYKKVIGIASNSPSVEAGKASIFRGIHWKHIKALEQLSIL